MSKTEFLQELKSELEGRVPHSLIQENLRYYDAYISDETAKGTPEAEVIENLGGPKIIGRTIVDAALDTEDRPDGYQTYGSPDSAYSDSSAGGFDQTPPPFRDQENRQVHYLDFSKWYVRLIAGLVVFFIIFLIMTIFFGIVGLAGWILSYIWPLLVVLLIVWMFKGPRR